jgi:hypothetical protein
VPGGLKSHPIQRNLKKKKLHKALIKSVMTYACPEWEFSADTTHILKLRRLQNKVFPNTGRFPKYTPVRELHVILQVPYTRIYDYVTKWFRQQAEVIQNHENAHVRDIGKGKNDTVNVRSLSLAAVKRTIVQVTRQPL